MSDEKDVTGWFLQDTRREIPLFRGFGQQRRRGLGALQQGIERTVFPFLSNYVVPTGKLVGADLLDFAAPEIAEVVSSRKKLKTLVKVVGGQTLR